MVVVDELDPGCNETIILDLDSLPDIELAILPDETVVTDDDSRPQLPNAIELKINAGLQHAFLSHSYLVWPICSQRGAPAALANAHALGPPI
jgi:hypothetical protein